MLIHLSDLSLNVERSVPDIDKRKLRLKRITAKKMRTDMKKGLAIVSLKL
jgi:hypothetical protein